MRSTVECDRKKAHEPTQRSARRREMEVGSVDGHGLPLPGGSSKLTEGFRKGSLGGLREREGVHERGSGTGGGGTFLDGEGARGGRSSRRGWGIREGWDVTNAEEWVGPPPPSCQDLAFNPPPIRSLNPPSPISQNRNHNRPDRCVLHNRAAFPSWMVVLRAPVLVL